MIKQICILLLCLLCVFCSNAGYSQSIKPPQKDSLIKAMLNVGDLIIIDGKACMVDKSFLSDIAGYKDLFPVPNDILANYMMDKGRDTEMNYFPIWTLEKNKLYLIGIRIESSKSNTINLLERSRLIAQLTGGKFTLDDIPQSKLDEMTYEVDRLIGAMPASWVTGDYYIYPCFIFGEISLKDWKVLPVQKLTISKGVIISTSFLLEKE